jgi:tRNA(Ile)-lysidine synthase
MNIKTILTGHHIEDLYENFFIRISRGSGLNGLISFSEKTLRDKVYIVRPLISFEKKHLNYVTTNVFKSYIEDPSNEDNKFKRVKKANKRIKKI